MPESKKLSELIEELINYLNEQKEEKIMGFSGKLYEEPILEVKNQIDQKFEELKLEVKVEDLPIYKSIIERIIKLEEMNKEKNVSKFPIRDGNLVCDRCSQIVGGCDFNKENSKLGIANRAIAYRDAIYEEDIKKENNKWSDIQIMISNRILSEYQKHKNLPEGFWITIAVKKIISSLKEYETDTCSNQ